MKTAIITTVFNEGTNVTRFLRSILCQRKLPDDLVIVDGGSTDDTFEQIEAFAPDFAARGVRYFAWRERCNIAEGRNRAIAATDATIICVTDAGVTLDNGWFEAVSRPLLRDPSVDYVGGNFVIAGENGVQRALRVVGFKNKRSNNPSSRSFAFRRSCWEAYPYPEHLVVHEDTKLCNEWRTLGFRFVHAPTACVEWLAEDTLPRLYRKFARYAEWTIRSGDRIDPLRKLQVATYSAAVVLLPWMPLGAAAIVAVAVALRLARQYRRAFRGFGGAAGLRLLPWAIAVQLTLDAATLFGFARGLRWRMRKVPA
jgi:glycosyltransferase involved in cell wall biosynthesis